MADPNLPSTEPASAAGRGVNPAALGVRCPECGSEDLEVLQTRRARDGRVLRRRRCRRCGRRISTSEHRLA